VTGYGREDLHFVESRDSGPTVSLAVEGPAARRSLSHSFIDLERGEAHEAGQVGKVRQERWAWEVACWYTYGERPGASTSGPSNRSIVTTAVARAAGRVALAVERPLLRLLPSSSLRPRRPSQSMIDGRLRPLAKLRCGSRFDRPQTRARRIRSRDPVHQAAPDTRLRDSADAAESERLLPRAPRARTLHGVDR
jgi:hypothetical protein